MNPRLTRKLEQLDTAFKRLEALLKQKQEVIVKQQDERENLIQERWRIQRDLATARIAKSERDDVLKVNETLHKRQAALREQLKEILEKVKTLSQSIQS